MRIAYTYIYYTHHASVCFDIFFATKSFPLHRFSEGTTTFQAGHHFTGLSCWSNKPWNTVEGRSRSKRGLVGDAVWIHPVFSLIHIWCWSDKTTSNNPWDTVQNMVDSCFIAFHSHKFHMTLECLPILHSSHRLKHRPEEVQHLIETSLPWILVTKWTECQFLASIEAISQIHEIFWFSFKFFNTM